MAKDIRGFVYLYHFERKFKHAGHYIGWTSDLEARDQEHQNGTGGRLLQVIRNEGISFRIVRTWEGTRNTERKLKLYKNTPKLCPVCNPPLGVNPSCLKPPVETPGMTLDGSAPDEPPY